MLSVKQLQGALLIAVLVSGASSTSALAQSFYQVAPTGSFYHTFGDAATDPLIIPLSDFSGATSLDLKPQGILQVAGSGSPQHDALFCGVFSTSATLLGSSLQERVPGALTSATVATSPCNSANTFSGNQPTDIVQDFLIPFTGLTAAVPEGAAYLFVAVPDNYFADNVSPNPAQYGLIVSTTTPESGTLALTGIGGVLLLGFSLRRRTC